MTKATAALNLDRTKSFRVGILSLFSSAFVLLLIARLGVLQLDQYHRWITLAKKQHSTSIQVLGSRGSILDTEGRPLAVSVKSFSVGVRPKDITDRARFSKAISSELGENPKILLAKLETQSNFIWLGTQLEEDTVKRIKASPFARDLAIVPDFKRVYPQGSIAGALLGRVGRDNNGVAGLEFAFENKLRAKPITFAVRRDAKGSLLTEHAEDIGDPDSLVGSLLAQLPSLFPEPVFASANKNETRPPSFTLRNEGQNIVSTIDSVVQSILEDELEQGKKLSQARRTFGVVMDAESGAVLAMGQTPIFDPNERDVASPELFRNVILQDAFEPGSTFKPFVIASAIDSGLASLEEVIDCENGKFAVGPVKIGDAHPQGLLSVRDVLIRSSNIGTAKLGLRVGGAKLYKTLRDFGFGRQTQQQISGETKGILSNGEKWKPMDVANKSFGQGVSVSSLQLVSAFSAFANDGEVASPYFVKGSKPERSRVISASTASQLRDALHGVVLDEHGTGSKAAIPGVDIYGKTGTAQKASATGGYDPNHVLSSFIGVADGTNVGIPRKLVVFIAVDEPGVTPRWGGTLAAPIFKRSISRTFSYLMGRS
jgi:cell division protein FtsI (penicillin-binding protein 3)